MSSLMNIASSPKCVIKLVRK